MDFPIDPDVDAVAVPAPGSSPVDHARRPRWARPRWDVLLVVFLGGGIGGWARYAITDAWPTRTGRFPWATLGVNVAGAFILGIVVVVATDVVSSRYVRPLLGTGFCGALTTFSSVVVTADLLFAHRHPATAVAYLIANILAGLAAVTLGLVLGRAVAVRSRREHRNGAPS